MSRRTRSGNPLVAVGTIRVSTDRQDLGPEAQRRAIEDFAAREGITVVAWFEDIGVSGASELDQRPGLMAAIEALRTHGAGCLIAHKRDRLARDPYTALCIERAAKAQGARVLTADGRANGESEDDAFMRGIDDLFAARERAMIRARTKAALAAKKARGERVGTVPYGYSADADGRLVADDAEQAVLALVRELHAAGMSSRKIAAELTARGILSRAGKPFLSASLCRLVATA